jgi:hypothetical protein
LELGSLENRDGDRSGVGGAFSGRTQTVRKDVIANVPELWCILHQVGGVVNLNLAVDGRSVKHHPGEDTVLEFIIESDRELSGRFKRNGVLVFHRIRKHVTQLGVELVY